MQEKNRIYFGTDGIRARANTSLMTASLALKVGMAAGAYFKRGNHRHHVVIGKDTRLSGYTIESALASGFLSMGMHVYLVGPLPTPAISMLVRSMRCDVGVMISASHNTYEDNGIKLFGPDGGKLSDKTELDIENLMQSKIDQHLVDAANLGRARRIDDAAGRYMEYVKRTLKNDMRLDGLKVVIDCANGAAYKVAPRVLWELGAEVITIGVNPDGTNINKNCGSTFPSNMASKVVEHSADIGIALDGDADRCIFSNEKGKILDGDQILALITKRWKDSGKLSRNGIVGTVMSNLGLETFLSNIGVELVRAPVGDRYVLSAMKEHKYNIGGEQSGHIILGNDVAMGDGLLVALEILSSLKESSEKLSVIGSCFKPVPQVTKNIDIPKGMDGKDILNYLEPELSKIAQQLGKSGRFMVRPSGTEPKIRIMAESNDKKILKNVLSKVFVAINKTIKEKRI